MPLGAALSAFATIHIHTHFLPILFQEVLLQHSLPRCTLLDSVFPLVLLEAQACAHRAALYFGLHFLLLMHEPLIFSFRHLPFPALFFTLFTLFCVHSLCLSSQAQNSLRICLSLSLRRTGSSSSTSSLSLLHSSHQSMQLASLHVALLCMAGCA